MSSPEIIGRLLFRHVRKELTAKEKAELSDWRKLSQRNEELFQTEANPERIRKVISHISESRNIAFQKLLEKYPQYREIKPTKPRARIYRIARIAAILIVVISVSLYFILNKISEGRPGGFRADLISSDNISQAMNDMVRGYNVAHAGIIINKKDNGELVYVAPDYPHAAKDKYYEVRTPRGGQFSVLFSDGTVAWLNAESSIKYPAKFSQDSINFIVKGEVYFEVSHSVDHFFTFTLPPTTNGKPPTEKTVQLKALNAHFDIKNYYDVNSGITMIRGVASLELDSLGGKKITSAMVHPGEEAKVFDTKIIVAMAQSDDEIVAWKNGMTTYHKASIQTIMRDISRWYNVDVEYMGSVPDKTFNLNISRDANLKEVLAALREQGIHLYLHAEKITVSP